MGSKSTIATAYVQLEPTLKGVTSGIENELKGVGKSGGKAISDSIGSKLTSAAGAIGKATAAAVGASITAVGAGVTALTKQAVESYANFEQLEGGIETLFGDSAQAVMDNASIAFRSAGMSMNDYMETSIQSAAALINSLEGDQAKAAELMDLSIVDMSDNVNKMGTSMEAVQNAYRGFSRGNFTMLDNLALGFAGTKQGMQELLDKAQEISGVEYNIDSYSDIVQAIHVVQTQMGITGTTAKEASTTISGSLNAVKASWQNLITGIADENADMGSLIDNLIGTVVGEGENAGFLDNILPRVETAVEGVGKFIEKAIPKVFAKLPGIVEQAFPGFIDSVASIMESAISAVPQLFNMASSILIMLVNKLNEELPTILPMAVSAIKTLIEGITSVLPSLIDSLLDATITIIETLLPELPGILESVLSLLETVANYILSDGLPKIVEVLPELLQGIVEFITESSAMITSAVVSIIDVIAAEALPEILTSLLKELPSLVTGVITGLLKSAPQLVSALVELTVLSLVAVPLIIAEILTRLPEIVTAIVEGFRENWPAIKEAGINAFEQFIEGAGSSEIVSGAAIAVGEFFENIIGEITGWFGNVKDEFISGITAAIDTFTEFGASIISAVEEFFRPAVETIITIWNWFDETFGPLLDALQNLVDACFEYIYSIAVSIWTSIKNFIIDTIWNPIVNFIKSCIETAKTTVETGFNFIKEKIFVPLQAAWDKVQEIWENIKTKFEETINTVHDFVAEKFEVIRSKIEEPLGQAKDKVSEIFNNIKETIMGVVNDALTWGKDLVGNFIKGISDNMPSLTEAVNGLANNIRERTHFSKPDKGPLADFDTYAPDMMRQFASGIRDNENLVTAQIERSFDFGPHMATSYQPALAGAGGGMPENATFIMPIYLGTEKIDERIITAQQLMNYKSGGR